jgi:hypothetical protein
MSIPESQIQSFLQDNIVDILKVCMGFQAPHTIHPPFRLSNKIEADLGVLDKSKVVVALFECKGEIGMNEIVRGLDQTAQYQYHIDNNIDYTYAPDAKSFFVIPKLVYDKYDFTKLSVPDRSILILADTVNNTFIHLTKKKIGTQNFKKTSIISPYYIRDNRLGEIYLGLKVIEAMSPKVISGKVSLAKVKAILKKIIVNKGNAINIGITLHGLGFIDQENRLTAEGQRHLRMDYHEFCKNLCHDQIKPYVNLMVSILVEIASAKGHKHDCIKTDLKEIHKKVKAKYNGNDVLYMTESGIRYISSWLNIMRDDLGIISFNKGSHKSGIKINFLPFEGLPFKLKNIPTNASNRMDAYVSKGLQFIARLK